jgi:DNA-binding transcriptional ArsR family regulator
MQDDLPLHLRPITFAANELALDLIYLIQSYTRKDLECVLIMLCVNDATMRPFMVKTPPATEVLAAPRPSEEIRGAISRRMLADKTGLSRETVRRKTQELADAGLVLVDDEGRVRSAQRLDEPEFQRTIEDGHRAVVRYRQRLESLGVAWDCVRA